MWVYCMLQKCYAVQWWAYQKHCTRNKEQQKPMYLRCRNKSIQNHQLKESFIYFEKFTIRWKDWWKTQWHFIFLKVDLVFFTFYFMCIEQRSLAWFPIHKETNCIHATLSDCFQFWSDKRPQDKYKHTHTHTHTVGGKQTKTETRKPKVL